MQRSKLVLPGALWSAKALLCVTLWATGGCLQPHFDLAQIKEMMPKRTADFDHLAMFVGEWETKGEIKMIGVDEPFAITGTSSAKWECDKRLVVDHATYDLGPLGAMTGISVWGFEPKAKRFRLWWFDSFSESAVGRASYDEETRTWTMKTKGKNAWCRIVNKGTVRQIDADNLEWTWTQWDAWHIWKISEMNGTSRRKQ